MTQTQAELTHENKQLNFNEWAQSEYVKISKFCAVKGYRVTNVNQKKCRYLAPAIAIWYVRTEDKKVDLWVVSGDFPTDLTLSTVAKNAREVLRHFSLTWQLQAAKLEDIPAEGTIGLTEKETRTKLSQELIKRAESLYTLYNDERLWEQAGLKK